jgi:transposase
MPQPNDLSRPLTALDQDSTLIAVIEMSQASWLVGAIVPGIERHPLKKLTPEAEELLRLLQRWRDEATKAGRTVKRIAVAFEAGRDGFWLARWLRARDIEAHVIHASRVAVSREHRRAKTDRLDVELLKRAFLGWLRGERDHCKMAAIPTLELEDARRPSREREVLVSERTRIINRMKSTLVRPGIRDFRPNLRTAPERLRALRTPEGVAVPGNTRTELERDIARLQLIKEQIKEIEQMRLTRMAQPPADARHAMLVLLARVVGVGIETADMLVNEVFVRNLRDRRAVARYAGLTGAPDESVARRREKGLARAGNARVRRGMLQIGVALFDVPERQRPGAMVPAAGGRSPTGHPQDHDHCPGAQIAPRPVAAGDHRRGAAGGCAASGRVMAGLSTSTKPGFGAPSSITDRR